jgi:hypothetical protein
MDDFAQGTNGSKYNILSILLSTMEYLDIVDPRDLCEELGNSLLEHILGIEFELVAAFVNRLLTRSCSHRTSPAKSDPGPRA